MAGMRITSDPEAAARTHTRPTARAAQRAAGDPAPFRQHPIRQSDRDRRPLAAALSLSLAIHALLLSLTFGGEEFGLPGLAFPWRDRRIEVPDLRIVLAPAHPPAESAVMSAAEPSRRAPIVPPRADAPVSGRPALAALAPRAIAATNAAPATLPSPADATRTEGSAGAATQAPVSARGPDLAPPAQIPEPAAVDTQTADGPWLVARTDRSAPAPVLSAAPSASSAETVPSAPPDAGQAVQEAQREEAFRQEAARVEFARLEAERKEGALQAAAQLDAERQQAARQEAARLEVARREAERREAARRAAEQRDAEQQAARQEAARVELARAEAEREAATLRSAARLDAERQEAARQEAARVEAARVEAERRETARQAAVQQEAEQQNLARQEAARAETARLAAERQAAAPQAAAQQAAAQQAAAQQAAAQQAAAQQAAAQQAAAQQAAAQQAEARREAALRAIGRQLDEEADRRQAAATASRPANALPYSLSTARRVRLWGRTDPNVELVEYAEAWARKIQLNTVVETIRELVNRPHTPSMVTVAVRSDGSVESVTFVVSSGVAAIDEAIRRIVESQRPYPAFPRALAREFDVIEIRRTWYFDSGIRLQ